MRLSAVDEKIDADVVEESNEEVETWHAIAGVCGKHLASAYGARAPWLKNAGGTDAGINALTSAMRCSYDQQAFSGALAAATDAVKALTAARFADALAEYLTYDLACIIVCPSGGVTDSSQNEYGVSPSQMGSRPTTVGVSATLGKSVVGRTTARVSAHDVPKNFDSSESADEIVFASDAFGALVGVPARSLLGKESATCLGFPTDADQQVMSPSRSFGEVLDGEQRSQVQSMQAAFLNTGFLFSGRSGMGREKSMASSVEHHLNLVALSTRQCQGGSWYLLHSMFASLSQTSVYKRSLFVLHVFTPLHISVPRDLWPDSGDVLTQTDMPVGLETAVEQLHDDAGASYWENGTDISIELVELAKAACESFANLATGALVRGHFVPQRCDACLIREAASLRQLITASFPREIRPAFSKLKEHSPLAWAIVERATADHSFLHVSPKLEELSGYPADFLLGRSVRILQPGFHALDEAFNASERHRQQDFLTRKRRGYMLSFALNEGRSGERFWSLVYTAHLEGKDSDTEQQALLIFAPIEVQKSYLDKLLLPNTSWTSEALDSWKSLCEILQEREHLVEPSEQPFLQLTEEAVGLWLLDAGKSVSHFWVGSNYCPVVGLQSARNFVRAGQWLAVANTWLRGLMESNKVQEDTWFGSESLDQAMTDAPGGTICAVSDAGSPGCPLVFATNSWVEQTGYTLEFALGRNCRFLQLQDGITNHHINGEELSRMRHFVKANRHKIGDTMTTLLLNERQNGERFWNLLTMMHVENCGRRLILSVMSVLPLPMPMLLMHRDAKSNATEKAEAFVQDVGRYLEFVRKLVRRTDEKEGQCRSVSYVGQFLMARALNYLKLHCDDWEGDHFVPCYGRELVDQFRQNGSAKWEYLLATIGRQRLVDVYGVVSDGQDVSMALMDPLGRDCPLVFVTREFECLTGYSSQWALGRNWRFILPKEKQRDELFNNPERHQVQSFCMNDGNQSTTPSGFGPNSLCVTLLIAQTRDGRPWWCFMAAERVEVEGRSYVLAAQVSPELQMTRLVEVLAMDSAGLSELARLRGILRKKSRRIDAGSSLRSVARRCVEQWVAGFPSTMDQHRFKLVVPTVAGLHTSISSSRSLEIPLVGLEVTFSTVGAVPSALENGVRHLHLAFPSGTSCDPRITELDSMLLALKVSDMLNYLLRFRFDYYLSSGLVVSMRTPPHLIEAFAEVQKALKSRKHTLSLWLLDASGGVRPQQIHDSWIKMSEYERAGTVFALGLYGGGEHAIDVVMRSRSAKLAAYGMDMSPGQPPGSELAKIYQLLGEISAIPIAYGLLGQRNYLLHSPVVKGVAAELKVEPVVPLLKWAEVQGCAAIVPLLDWTSSSAPRDLDGGDGVADDPHANLHDESTDIPAAPAYPRIHRRLIRELQAVDPTAVYIMEARLSGIEEDQDPFLLHSQRGFIIDGGADPVPLRLAGTKAREHVHGGGIRGLRVGGVVPITAVELHQAEDQHPQHGMYPKMDLAVPLRLPAANRMHNSVPHGSSLKLARSGSGALRWLPSRGAGPYTAKNPNNFGMVAPAVGGCMAGTSMEQPPTQFALPLLQREVDSSAEVASAGAMPGQKNQIVPLSLQEDISVTPRTGTSPRIGTTPRKLRPLDPGPRSKRGANKQKPQ